MVNGGYYASRNLGVGKYLPKYTNKVAFFLGIFSIAKYNRNKDLISVFVGSAVGLVAVGAVISFAGAAGFIDRSAWLRSTTRFLDFLAIL